MPATKFDEPTRDRILRIASELFYARGITATGVDVVARETGVAKTTMYSHFGSKDGLVGAYLSARGEAWRAHLMAAVLEVEDPRDRVLAVFDVLGAWMAGPEFRGCPFINAAGELCDDAHPGVRATAAHRALLRSFIVELARDAGARTPEVTGGQLLLLYDAAMVDAQLDGDTATVIRQARAGAAVLLADATGAER